MQLFSDAYVSIYYVAVDFKECHFRLYTGISWLLIPIDVSPSTINISGKVTNLGKFTPSYSIVTGHPMITNLILS